MSQNRNSKRSRGSRRASGGSNMLSAIALMIIAILLLVFVFAYISNNSFLSFFKRFKSDGSETETTSDETKTQDAADEPGLVWLDKDELVYVLSEDELSDREDSDIIEEDGKKLLASEWLEDGSDLYYFDDKGRAVSDLNEGAFNYRFDREYRLYSISYNNAYISESENDQKDYPGVVQTKTLWAFLDTEKQVDDLYAIKYKKTTESFSHLLGGDSNLQYTSNFAMNVADGYIYYVAFVDASDKMLEPIANKLFRMKPGAEKREICAEDIKGYKLIGAGNGDIHVYVDDGTKVKRVTSFKEDESMKTFPEDGDYYVVTDRWQKFTEVCVNAEILDELSAQCDEFLIHGVDVEGKASGVEKDLVRLLAEWGKRSMTYAGGIGSLEELQEFADLSRGKLDYTIGSALDLFGGTIPYRKIVEESRI